MSGYATYYNSVSLKYISNNEEKTLSSDNSTFDKTVNINGTFELNDVVESFYLEFHFTSSEMKTSKEYYEYVYAVIIQFTLYGADGSPIYFIGSDGSRYQLARYNDEYTPLVFTDSHGGTNNILLVNPLKSCASPIRLCCKNPDGSYPSERLRTYCERMGVSDGILAPATYTPPS